ncbi:hypothetical protein TNCV_2300841 [Trichonephila clavipes]|nr:hypothetical protein TNCV_2300841 [Trichonephila clavipes]
MAPTPCHHTSCESGVPLFNEDRIETFPTGSPHTIVITTQIKSGLITEDDMIPSDCSSRATPLKTEAMVSGVDVSGSKRNERDHSNCPSTRCLVMTQRPLVKMLPV